MTKPVESRSIKVSVTILEREVGPYSTPKDVGSTDIVVELPASAQAIGTATANAVEMLARNADMFRGIVPAPEVVDA